MSLCIIFSPGSPKVIKDVATKSPTTRRRRKVFLKKPSTIGPGKKVVMYCYTYYPSIHNLSASTLSDLYYLHLSTLPPDASRNIQRRWCYRWRAVSNSITFEKREHHRSVRIKLRDLRKDVIPPLSRTRKSFHQQLNSTSCKRN